jgi:hypothetical protein
MASTINASTSGSGGLISSGDASGVLQLQTNGTIAVTVATTGYIGLGTTTPSSNNGAVSNILNIAGTNNVIFNGTTTTSTNGLIIEANQTGRSTISRFAQMVLNQDGSSNGAFTLQLASSGADVSAVMSVQSNGNLQFNSGYGSVTTAYGCRAYASFNGSGGVTYYAQKGVSSITRSSTGIYVVSLSFTMPDTNYGIVMGGGKLTAASDYSGNTSNMSPYSIGTSGFNIVVNCPTQGTSQDSQYIAFACFR